MYIRKLETLILDIGTLTTKVITFIMQWGHVRISGRGPRNNKLGLTVSSEIKKKPHESSLKVQIIKVYEYRSTYKELGLWSVERCKNPPWLRCK